LQTSPVGSGPYFMAYNGLTQTIWVANRNSANVTVLNQTGIPVTTISTGAEPQFLAWDGGTNMWVSCYSSQLVEQFSSSGVLEASYAITGHGQPSGIAFEGGALYGVTQNGRVFSIFSGLVHYSSGAIGDNNYDIAFDQNHSSLWVTDLNQGIVVRVSP